MVALGGGLFLMSEVPLYTSVIFGTHPSTLERKRSRAYQIGEPDFISHTVFLKSLYKTQFPHKSVNRFVR